MRPQRIGLAWGAVWLAAATMHGGTEPPLCPPLTIPVHTQAINFTIQQEADLGDAIAEHTGGSLMVVGNGRDPYLQGLADHVLAQMPASVTRVQVYLVNLPIMNAFTIPGGRVYVTRKLVAATRSEDELAGVIGHELGHVVTRQPAVDISTLFREALSVTTFGDRADIFDKYRRLVESVGPGRSSWKNHDRQQYEADRVALMAVARGGYAPEGLITFWDRFHETEGRTGNAFTDFFGATPPESRRLREMLRSLSALPGGCPPSPRAATAERFDAWRKRVIETDTAASSTAGRGVISETALEPALGSDLRRLRFSPDGRHVLAQDEANIYVLSREPFEVRFRIDAHDALPAQFTTDSTSVVFHTRALRVERWDIASGRRTGAHELVPRDVCLQSTLSPDGRTLGCLDSMMQAVIMDVASAETLFRKSTGLVVNYLTLLRTLARGETPTFAQLAFSPDSRYFIVSNVGLVTILDVVTKAAADLPGNIKGALKNNFAFLGLDRIVTVNNDKVQDSAIVEFPSGKRLQRVTLGGTVESVTRGEFAILRPIQDWPLGLVDLTSNKVVLASRTTALDAYDSVHLTERPNGELGLYQLGSREPLAVATLGGFRLGRLSASDVTPDLGLLAISLRERGAVWDLATGKRVAYVRGFQAVHIAADNTVYADFPDRMTVVDGKRVERARTRARIDLGRGDTRDLPPPADEDGYQRGAYFFVFRPADKRAAHRDVTLEVRDATSDTLLWTRRFEHEAPARYLHVESGRMVLEWPVSSFAAKERIRGDRRLSELVTNDRLRGGDAYLEVVNLTDGAVVGRLLINTGRDERKIRDALSVGDVVVVSDRHNQTICYSMATNKRLGSVFGRTVAASAQAELVVVQNDTDTLQVHDLATLAKTEDLAVPSGPRLVRFSADGTRLLVVGANQRVMIVATAALGAR